MFPPGGFGESSSRQDQERRVLVSDRGQLPRLEKRISDEGDTDRLCRPYRRYIKNVAANRMGSGISRVEAPNRFDPKPFPEEGEVEIAWMFL